MKKFNLTLLTPERIYYKGEVYQVSVHQEDGLTQILADHEPSTGLITEGFCNFTDGRNIKRIFVTKSGFVNIERDKVTISSTEIYSERAYEKAIEDAENNRKKEIERRHKSRDEYVRTRLELAKSLSSKNTKKIDN